jgi:hypothetical protein
MPLNCIFFNRLGDNLDAMVDQLQGWGLLATDFPCPICGRNLDLGKSSTAADGLMWRCRGTIEKPKKAPVPCNYRCPVREKTFFSRSHLKIWQILAFAHLWTQRVERQTISNEVEISNRTATDWDSFCREVVYDAFIVNGKALGGPGKTVEIDESKFGRRKHYRGHRVEGQWVFGGIERESGRVFMVPVDDDDDDDDDEDDQ